MILTDVTDSVAEIAFFRVCFGEVPAHAKEPDHPRVMPPIVNAPTRSRVGETRIFGSFRVPPVWGAGAMGHTF